MFQSAAVGNVNQGSQFGIVLQFCVSLGSFSLFLKLYSTSFLTVEKFVGSVLKLICYFCIFLIGSQGVGV